MTDIQTFARLTPTEKRIESYADMPNGMRLSVVTHKTFDGLLVTRASAARVEDGFVKYVMGRDYNVVLERAKVRCTSKNVQAQHDFYLESFPILMEAATKYYEEVTIGKLDA